VLTVRCDGFRDTSFPIRDDKGRVQRLGGIAEDIAKFDGSHIYVVDGDESARRDLMRLLQTAGYVAPPSSYLNDVRFSPDGKWAYITDSGKGAIVVVDLATGQGRRFLDGHPSTQFQKDVTIVIDGRELRRPTEVSPCSTLMASPSIGAASTCIGKRSREKRSTASRRQPLWM
jgi:hypothetical protein